MVLTRFISGLLVGVPALDPVTFVAVGLLSGRRRDQCRMDPRVACRLGESDRGIAVGVVAVPLPVSLFRKRAMTIDIRPPRLGLKLVTSIRTAI